MHCYDEPAERSSVHQRRTSIYRRRGCTGRYSVPDQATRAVPYLHPRLEGCCPDWRLPVERGGPGHDPCTVWWRHKGRIHRPGRHLGEGPLCALGRRIRGGVHGYDQPPVRRSVQQRRTSIGRRRRGPRRGEVPYQGAGGIPYLDLVHNRRSPDWRLPVEHWGPSHDGSAVWRGNERRLHPSTCYLGEGPLRALLWRGRGGEARGHAPAIGLAVRQPGTAICYFRHGGRGLPVYGPRCV